MIRPPRFLGTPSVFSTGLIVISLLSMRVHLSAGAIPFSVLFRAHCLCNEASVAFLLFSDSFSAFSILSCAKTQLSGGGGRPAYLWRCRIGSLVVNKPSGLLVVGHRVRWTLSMTLRFNVRRYIRSNSSRYTSARPAS